MQILLLGDCHGRLDLVHHACVEAQAAYGIEAAIQVGDFGFYPEILHMFLHEGPRRFPVPLHVIDGNHEDHGWLTKCRADGTLATWEISFPNTNDNKFHYFISNAANETIHFDDSLNAFARCMQLRQRILMNGKLLESLVKEFNLDIKNHPELIGTWINYSPYRIFTRFYYSRNDPTGPKYHLKILDELGQYAGANVEFSIEESNGNICRTTASIAAQTSLQIVEEPATSSPIKSSCKVFHNNHIIAEFDSYLLQSIQINSQVQNPPLRLPSGTLVQRQSSAGSTQVGATTVNAGNLLAQRNRRLGWTQGDEISVDWQIPQLINDSQEGDSIRDYIDKNHSERLIVCDPYFCASDVMKLVEYCGSNGERDVLIITRCNHIPTTEKLVDTELLNLLQATCATIKGQHVFREIIAIEAPREFHDRWILAEGQNPILIVTGKSWNSFGKAFGFASCLRGPGPFFTQLELTTTILNAQDMFSISDVLKFAKTIPAPPAVVKTAPADPPINMSGCLAIPFGLFARRAKRPVEKSVAVPLSQDIRSKIKNGDIFSSNRILSYKFWEPTIPALMETIHAIDYGYEIERSLHADIRKALINEDDQCTTQAWDLCLDDASGALANYCLSYAVGQSTPPTFSANADKDRSSHLLSVYGAVAKTFSSLAPNQLITAAVAWILSNRWDTISTLVEKKYYDGIVMEMVRQLKPHGYNKFRSSAFEAMYPLCTASTQKSSCDQLVKLFSHEEYPGDALFETMIFLDNPTTNTVKRCLKMVEFFLQPFFRQTYYARWLQAVKKLKDFDALTSRLPSNSGAVIIKNLVAQSQKYRDFDDHR